MENIDAERLKKLLAEYKNVKKILEDENIEKLKKLTNNILYTGIQFSDVDINFRDIKVEDYLCITNYEENRKFIENRFGVDIDHPFKLQKGASYIRVDLEKLNFKICFDFELLYTNFKIITLGELKQILREKSISDLLND